MMELSERIEELLDEHDFSVCGDISERYGEKGRYDIELETYSPEGEDVLVSLTYDGTEKDFIREFNDYAEGFDAEDHAEMWIECRGKNGADSHTLFKRCVLVEITHTHLLCPLYFALIRHKPACDNIHKSRFSLTVCTNKPYVLALQ